MNRNDTLDPLKKICHEVGVEFIDFLPGYELYRGHSFCVSPDGKRLANAFNKVALVWDLTQPGSEPMQMLGHTEGITRLIFASDGRLVTGSYDKTARVWNLPAKHSPSFNCESIELQGHRRPVRCLAASPHGMIATGSTEDSLILVWDLADLKKFRLAEGGYTAWVRGMVFGPGDQLVAHMDEMGSIWVWEVPKPATLKNRIKKLIHLLCYGPQKQIFGLNILDGNFHNVYCMGFAKDGRLVAGYADFHVRIWNIFEKKRPQLILKGHKGSVMCLSFAPDGRLVTGSTDRTIRVWDTMDFTGPTIVLRGFSVGVRSLGVTSDNQCVISASDQLTIHPIKGGKGTVLCESIDSNLIIRDDTLLFTLKGVPVMLRGNLSALLGKGLEIVKPQQNDMNQE